MKLRDFNGILFALAVVLLVVFMGLVYTGHLLSLKTRSGAPDFAILPSPSIRRVEQARDAIYRITIRPTAGYSEDIRLSIAGATGFLSPSRIRPPGVTRLTITTSLRTVPATYPITIIGRSGVLLRRARVLLVVEPATPVHTPAEPAAADRD